MKTITTRRDFIKYTSALGMGLVFNPMQDLSADSLDTSTANAKRIVVLHLHGGLDSLSAFVPYSDDKYYELRPNSAVSKSHYGANSNLILNENFGLHPKLEPLKEIWDAGHMSLFPATNNGSHTRSHFSQLDLYDIGGYAGIANQKNSGWAKAYIEDKNPNSKSDLIGLSYNQDGKMFGNLLGYTFQTSSLLNSGYLSTDEEAYAVLSNKSKDRDPNTVLGKYQQVQDSFFSMDKKIQQKKDAISSSTFTVEFPENELGKQLKEAVIGLKEFNDLAIIEVAQRGYDTHSTHNFDGLFDTLAKSISAFYKGLEQYGLEDDVVLVVKSEFGRTVAENTRQGTEHGVAGAWFVIGHSVNGGANEGAIHGGWNNLSNADTQRYIEQETDYRDVLSEVLSWAGMTNPGDCFEGNYAYNANKLPFLNK